MRGVLVAEARITVGQPHVVEGPAPNTHYGAMFEDEGETGYFYALDRSATDQPIVDARHIYNADRASDRTLPLLVQIAWSSDGYKVALVIDESPHAMIDFAARRSYCRTGDPPPKAAWSDHDASWDEAAVELLR
jgi:hypothetical protein